MHQTTNSSPSSSTFICHACSDQQIYVQPLNPDGSAAGEPKALTNADSCQRFADYILDKGRGRLIGVCEDHSGKGEAVTSVAAIDVTSGEVRLQRWGSSTWSACP
jgi:hypothetical protein